MSRIARLAELRRSLAVLGALLLLVALTMPMWRITLEAPQYPTRDLFVELYAYPRIDGEVEEIQALNRYVGFYYPDPVYTDPNYEVNEKAISVPEWTFGPVAFVAVAASSLFVAVAPTARKLKVGLTCQLAGTVAVFVGMFALIQYRLHQAGHALDPDAPMRGVEPFTPPLLGPYEVANISGFAWFASGGYLTMLALVSIVLAFRLRNSEATIADVPSLIRAIPGRVRDLPNRLRRLPGRIRGQPGRIHGRPGRIRGLANRIRTWRDSAGDDGGAADRVVERGGEPP